MSLEQKRQHKKFLITTLGIIALIIVAGGAWYSHRVPEPQPLLKPEVTYNAPTDQTHTAEPNDSDGTTTPSEKPLPPSLLIKVPFTAQAPTANWDELHNESCEEATSIMANAYFRQINSLPPHTFENELTKLTEWEDKNFGYHLDITTEDTAKLLRSVYGLKAEVAPTSSDTIKQALAANKLVALAANGQLLKNPFYKQPGPIYHMLLITGYNEKGFITNDPGTKRGENYQYDFDTLNTANGTWNINRHEVDLSQKQIIIISLN